MLLRLFFFSLSSFVLFSCSNTNNNDSRGVSEQQMVNVYTQRHYDTDDSLFALFTRKTGIEVNLVKAKADELINRLELEGKNSPADLLITVDAERLYRAKNKGLLQAVDSEILKNTLMPELRDVNLYWHALTYRVRILVYDKQKVTVDELSDYLSLADEKWKGKILVRSSESSYNQSLLASIIVNSSVDIAKNWAAGLVANMARTPKGNDRDQVKALAAGEGAIAIINSYYLALLHNSSNEAERNAASKVSVFFPNQTTSGTHMNISGMALTASSKNKEAAIKLMEFLVSDEAQQYLTDNNYEYPASKNVEPNALLKSWGDFKADFKALALLEDEHTNAMKIFNEAGWK